MKEKQIPIVGDIYSHQNGTQYTVIAITNLDSTNSEYIPQVVYRGSNGKIWSIPLENFNEKMTKVVSKTDEEIVADLMQEFYDKLKNKEY